jgi:hypothetical protein
VGLGPRGTSLAQRVSLPPPVWSNPFAMQMEGIARAEARRERAIWHRMKHAAPRKPEAPVTPKPKEKGKSRTWLWVGEGIASKGMYEGYTYTAEQLRKAGFKLPKIGGKK